MMIKENDSYQDVMKTKKLQISSCHSFQKSYKFSSPVQEEQNTETTILLLDSNGFKLKFRAGAKNTLEVT